MPVSYDRVLPLASVRLYDVGQGDPITTDQGFKWYDPLIQSYKNATVSRDSLNQNTLEYIEGVGLICRPFLALKDTRKDHYTLTGGAWDERRPSTGNPRTYRLVQYSAASNTTWSAESKFSIPANHSWAFSLTILDSPADNDFETYPPYVRVEFGGGEWALEFSKTNGSHLLKKISGTLMPVMEINDPQVISSSEASEKLMVVRVQRGKIGISTNHGQEYQWFEYGDGTPANIPQGKLTLRGQGGMCVFGLHQIRYKTGTYTSPPRNTFTSRPLATAALAGRYATPTGTGVTFSDVTSGTYARYTATLTPASTHATPFDFYISPELYAVKFVFPVVTVNTSLSYTTPWDGELLNITVDKPLELSSSSCTIQVRKDTADQFTGDYRWRKVRTRLGGRTEDGTETLTTVFTGYISTIEVNQSDSGTSTLTIGLENASIRARRQNWDDFTCSPLGGQSVNDALDEILDSMGLDVSYRSWHSRGDTYILPAGSPEDPFLWVQPGDNKFEMMQQIARYAGLEIAVTDDGIYSSGPIEYVDTLASHTWEADPASGSENALYSIQNATYRFDSGEAYTAVVIRGSDEWQNSIYAYGVDVAAETDVSNYRFCPWRELYREEVGGTSTLPALIWLAAAKYSEYATLKFEGEVTVPVNLDVLRRQRVQFDGLKVGIGDSDEFVVLTIRHEYQADPSFSTLSTTLGIRRLGA